MKKPGKGEQRAERGPGLEAREMDKRVDEAGKVQREESPAGAPITLIRRST